MSDPSEAIAKYTETLVASRDRTSRSEDRLAYTRHLAAAAEMSAAAHKRNLEALIELVAGEERNFGRSYLSGEEGQSAERAFTHLARTIRSLPVA